MAQTHLLDFFFDGRGDGGVADVRIDLHQKIPPDNHRFAFRMIDVRRNDRAAARDFVADKFRRNVFGMRAPQACPGCCCHTATMPIVARHQIAR